MIAPRRTAIALLAATLLTLGVAGCGIKVKDGSGVDTGGDTVTSTTAAASTTTEADDPPETTAPDDETTTEPDDTETTTTVTSDGGDTDNPKVAAYCQAVQDYVDKVQAATSDPSLYAELATEGEKLSTLAQGLATAGLTAADAQAVADCTQEATNALTGG